MAEDEQGDQSGIEETPPGIPEPYSEDTTEDEEPQRYAGKPMDFMEHLDELRTRLLRAIVYAAVGAIVGWFLYGHIYRLLMYPVQAHLDPKRTPIVWHSPMEPLLMQMQVSAIAGILLFSPLIFYEVWAFVYPALLPKERRCLIPIIPGSFLLFVAGVALAYFVLPEFFLFLQRFWPEGSVVFNSVRWYLPFLAKICLGMGLVFQMPIAFFILAKLGLVTARTLISKWRHAVVIIFFAAAIITPTPDPVNMSLLAVPILGLYVLSIIVVKLSESREPDLAG